MKFSQRINSNSFVKVLKTQVNVRLAEFREYTQEIESKFDSDKAKLAQIYRDSVKDLSQEEASLIDEYFSDECYAIEEVYVGLYRKSTLVSVYSFLENAMNSLCRYLATENSYSYALSDLKGGGIERARNYLNKSAGVDFDPLNGEWSELTMLNKVRNCIVHCEGDISACKNKSIAKIIQKTRGLSLRNKHLITVERSYIDACINTVEVFLEKLCNQAL